MWSLIPKQSEGNNYKSKTNVFPVSHTIFFLLGGQEIDLFAPHGTIKSTLWPASRKKILDILNEYYFILKIKITIITGLEDENNYYFWYFDLIYKTYYVCISFRVHKWRSLLNQTYRLWSEPSSVIFIKIVYVGRKESFFFNKKPWLNMEFLILIFIFLWNIFWRHII